MAIVYDPEKNWKNIAKRDLSFDRVTAFEWPTADVKVDRRRDYGETRFIAVGLLEARLHVLVFTMRGADIRVISLRRANQREQASYDKIAGSLPRR